MQKKTLSGLSGKKFVKVSIYPLLRRFPSRLKVLLRVINAVIHKEIRIVSVKERIPQDTYRIEFSDDLSTIRARYCWRGMIIEREQTPALAYHTPAGYITNLGVLSHGKKKPDQYVFHFRGVEIQYFTNLGVWPPSLSSFVLTAALIDNWQKSDNLVWDVGCGSGIIGIYLKRLTGCQEVLMTDSDPDAIELARINVRNLGLQGCEFMEEAFPPSITPVRIYDLIVCNPPWFPDGFVLAETSDRPTLDDLPLLKALLQYGPLWAKRVVLGFPGIMLEEITRHLLQLDSSGIKWKVLGKQRLPLPWRVIGHKKLQELPDGLFHEGPSADYDLWHNFYIYEVRSSG